ncbi:MAG: TMEM175 family protein [Flavobacteriaceae bacterium]
MTTNRLEAFSDGVLAIVITIMVLEMQVPEGSSWSHLKPVLPKFTSYVLSFIYLGIYWNNHHHLFQAIQKVNGKVLWANLFLLFTLSLLPFTTAWMGENHFEKNPVILYGLNLLLCAIAFLILEKTSTSSDGKSSVISSALESNRKEIISIVLYLIGVITAIFYPIIGLIFFVIVAIVWLIPDKRIENKLKN